MKELIESYFDFENTTDKWAKPIWKNFKRELRLRSLDPYDVYVNETAGQTDLFYLPHSMANRFYHKAKVFIIISTVFPKINAGLKYTPP